MLSEIRKGADADANVRRWWAGVTDADVHLSVIVLGGASSASVIATIWRRQMPSVVDSMIAATAMVHGLTVVTRNVRDFTGTGVRFLNPYAP